MMLKNWISKVAATFCCFSLVFSAAAATVVRVREFSTYLTNDSTSPDVVFENITADLEGSSRTSNMFAFFSTGTRTLPLNITFKNVSLSFRNEKNPADTHVFSGNGVNVNITEIGDVHYIHNGVEQKYTISASNYFVWNNLAA